MKIKIMMKKLAGGHNKLIIFLTLITFIFNKGVLASKILDYETDQFIKSLINEVKSVNNFKKDIKFNIISDTNINAFVDQNNIIYITSGLIENCEDYIALLSVIAHEIGHIENNHIAQRKYNFGKAKNLNALSKLSIIAGSMMSNNPEMLQGINIGSAGISNYYINFSKSQEEEADFYSLQTIKNLKLNSSSVVNLLKLIEKKGLERGISKEEMRVGTHPYFEDRIDLINYSNNNSNFFVNEKLNEQFYFIQAKYIGHNENSNLIHNIKEPFKIYAESIIKAKNGDLLGSLKNLNYLITTNNENIYLIETKGDILFSYGYTKEALEFYDKVLLKLPDNIYAQIRIFENTDFNNLTLSENEEIFYKNLNILQKYYNNKNLLLAYIKLSQSTNKDDWVNFLFYWINKNNDQKEINKNLKKFMETDDKYLFNLLKIIYNNNK